MWAMGRAGTRPTEPPGSRLNIEKVVQPYARLSTSFAQPAGKIEKRAGSLSTGGLLADADIAQAAHVQPGQLAALTSRLENGTPKSGLEQARVSQKCKEGSLGHGWYASVK